jgi:hypothetical protein
MCVNEDQCCGTQSIRRTFLSAKIQFAYAGSLETGNPLSEDRAMMTPHQLRHRALEFERGEQQPCYAPPENGVGTMPYTSCPSPEGRPTWCRQSRPRERPRINYSVLVLPSGCVVYRLVYGAEERK